MGHFLILAEEERFELSREIAPPYSFSKAAPSATWVLLRIFRTFVRVAYVRWKYIIPAHYFVKRQALDRHQPLGYSSVYSALSCAWLTFAGNTLYQLTTSSSDKRLTDISHLGTPPYIPHFRARGLVYCSTPGGEGEIRTRGGSPHACFQDKYHQPLGHLSRYVLHTVQYCIRGQASRREVGGRLPPRIWWRRQHHEAQLCRRGLSLPSYRCRR